MPQIKQPNEKYDDFIDRFASRMQISKSQAREVIEGMSDEIINTLNNGHDVNLPAIGHFRLMHREPRTVNSPLMSGPTEVEESWWIGFKSGAKLNRRLSQNGGH